MPHDLARRRIEPLAMPRRRRDRLAVDPELNGFELELGGLVHARPRAEAAMILQRFDQNSRMAASIVPARYELRNETPYSSAYGDGYHSAGGGLAQARPAFLAGNGLPERWARRDRCVLLETGFGMGLNFLATWR